MQTIVFEVRSQELRTTNLVVRGFQPLWKQIMVYSRL